MAATTEWIVIRPEAHIAGSKLASVFEGEWRRRAEVGEDGFVELDGPSGPVRAYPTDQVERSADGNVGQVWQVSGDTGLSDTSRGLDLPPDEPGGADPSA